MPRTHRLQLGPARYLRRQPPATYKHNGVVRPCHVCGWNDHPDGRKLYAYVRIEPRGRYQWVNGERRVEMETLPDGEVVMRKFEMMQATNYHVECEAEAERARRKTRPKGESWRAQLERKVEELTARLNGRADTARQSPAKDLAAIAPVSASLAGSGLTHAAGQRTRAQVAKRWAPGSLQEHITSIGERAKSSEQMREEYRQRQEVMDSLAMTGQPASESQSDPDSTPLPTRKPPPLDYDPDAPLGEPGVG